MTEKVKLPKAVCDALDKASVIHDECTIIYKVLECSFFNELGVLCDVDANLLMRALVLGYEPEMTAEEHMKEIFLIRKHCEDVFNEGYCTGVRQALWIHGIKYDWLDGDAE